MRTLNEIGLCYNSDKSSEFHNYLELYDKEFSNIRNNENNILEIGILNGDSLNILSEYFYNSKIYAIDIDDKKRYDNEKIKTYIGDQSDINFLNNFDDNFFEVILDDGSHRMNHQQISLSILFKKLKSGGIYIIEDLHTSLYNYKETINYGKGLFGLNDNNDNNTIDFLKNLKNENLKNYYMSNEDLIYIQNNVENIEIIQTAYRTEGNVSITSIIKKK